VNFENTFVVQAPIDDVWATLMDLERVAPCMPGAEVLERLGENEFRVAVRVKLGPMSLQYRGQVAIVERDDAARHALLRARATEARGQGTADARIGMALTEAADGTRGTISTELQISGRAAAMGRGMIVDVAQKLTELFAVNLAEMLVAVPEQPVGADAAGAAQTASASEARAQTSTMTAPAATETVRAADGGRTATEPVRAPAGAPAESSLPVMQVAASVIGGRLSNPRTLLGSAGVLAFLFGAIGYAIGRRR